jgi:hypothetical protein
MNRYAITLGAATALAGALLASVATAATVNRSTYTQASGTCQGALPNYEGSFRKRPLAVANEGSAGAFITCGIQNNENSSVNAVELYVTNRSGADVDVNCTMVDGLVDADFDFADFYPQTVTVTDGVDGAFVWNDGGYIWPAISCNVPAHVEANMVYTSIDEQVGA